MFLFMFSMKFLQYEPIIIIFLSGIFASLYYLNLLKYNDETIFKHGKDEYCCIITKPYNLKSFLLHLGSMFLLMIIAIGINNYFPSLDEFYFYNSDFSFSFIIIALTLIGYYSYNISRYEYNIISIVRQICKVAIIVSLIEALCLRFREPRPNTYFLCCLLVGIFFNMAFHYLLGEVRYDLSYNENEKGYKEKPVSTKKELLTSRQNQVDYLLSEFRKIASDEPYAALLDGKWGQGKTSLITAIKNEKSEFRFVYVSVGYSVNIKELLYDIEKQIRNIFNELDFYYESSGNLHSYFKTMCKLSAATVDERIGKIYDAVIQDNETFEAKKDDLNNILDDFYIQTQKKIIIIIDDLERCHSDNIKNIFALLMETCNLHSCTTLLVCDYKKLIETGAVSEDYIDKYINRRYTMAYVSYREIYYQMIFDCLVGNKDESEYVSARYRWLNNLERMESILNQIEDIANNETNAKNYSIEKEDYKLFRLNSIKLKDRLSDMLSTPRFSKKIWILGVSKAIDILEKTDYKGGDYNDIDVDLVAIFYGILLYGLSNIYDEIFQFHGIVPYAKYYRGVPKDKFSERYYDYVVIASLLNNLKPKDLMALNWLINFQEVMKLSDYKTEKEKIMEEWEAVDSRDINHFELYLEYVADNMNTLKELIQFLSDNIDEDFSYEYFENYYLVFINIYNPDNDDELCDLYDCYHIFDNCVEKYINTKEDIIYVIDTSNKFNRYTSSFFYQRIAEIVWIITLSLIPAEKINAAEIYKNVNDKTSYIAFLRQVVKNLDVKDEYRVRIDHFLNVIKGDKDVYRLTKMIFDVCFENEKYNNSLHSKLFDIEQILDMHLEKLKDLEKYVINNLFDGSSYIKDLIEEFVNANDINNDNLYSIVENRDQITEEIKDNYYIKFMSRLKDVLLLVIDETDGCYDNAESLNNLETTIELVRDLSSMYNNTNSIKKTNTCYYEIQFLLEAARLKISSSTSLITETRS